MMDWSNRVVLITGASSGIGRGLALELARRGAYLGLLARGVESRQLSAAAGSAAILSQTAIEPSPRLLEVVDQIRRETDSSRKAGAQRTMALAADVRDARSVRAAADRLRDEFGRIDVLIANAGIGATRDATELDPEEVQAGLNGKGMW